MKRYDSYKDSGVDWIGEIPSHWVVSELRQLVYHTKEKNSDNQSTVLSLSYGDIVIRNIEFNYGLLPESFDSYQRIRPGYIVLRLTDLQNDKKSLRVGYSHYDGIITSVYVGLRVQQNIESRWVYYFLHFSDLKKVFYSLGGGIRQSLRFEELGRIPVCTPTISEQQQIVSFLDSKTSQIDELIQKKERKIELLKEYRTSLINQVVTKGLNPNVEMKDSGVEWIGEIPTSWDTLQLKYITEILRGKFSHRPRNDERLYDGVYPFIQTGDIVSSGKYLTKYTQTLNEWGYSVSKEFPIGTLVMTISGNIGDVSILKIKSCFPDSIIGFFPKSITSEEYLFYLFSSLKQELIKNSTVSTQMNLNVERVGSIFVTLPPLSEQHKIVSYLDEHTELIVKTISIEEERIELLKVYRQSLISEVVTGKMDVRVN